MTTRRTYLKRRAVVGLAIVVVTALAVIGLIWVATTAGTPCYVNVMNGVR